MQLKDKFIIVVILLFGLLQISQYNINKHQAQINQKVIKK